MTFVDVYAVTTGTKQRIPAAWLDHPVLGRQFRKTPSSTAPKTSSPFAAKTVDELKEYAAQHHVDVAGLNTKADLVAAVSTPNEPAPDAGKE